MADVAATTAVPIPNVKPAHLQLAGHRCFQRDWSPRLWLPEWASLIQIHHFSTRQARTFHLSLPRELQIPWPEASVQEISDPPTFSTESTHLNSQGCNTTVTAPFPSPRRFHGIMRKFFFTHCRWMEAFKLKIRRQNLSLLPSALAAASTACRSCCPRSSLLEKLIGGSRQKRGRRRSCSSREENQVGSARPRQAA